MGDRNYCYARAYRHYLMSRFRDKPYLFIHTMGKVGSSTIERSFREKKLDQEMTIYWTHFLSPEGVKFLEKLEINGYGDWNRFPPNIKSLISRSRVLSNQLRKGRFNGKKCKVVTLVRDPIATNISGYFQNHGWWPQELIDKCMNYSPDYIDELIKNFHDNYPHEVPVTWFDTEMKPVFGIDVYSTEFIKDTGFCIIKGRFSDILIIKLEKLDDCANEAFGKFLDINDFEVIKDNLAREKWYQSIYQEFIEKIILPASYIDRMYASKFANHFYTQDEINSLRARWEKISIQNNEEQNLPVLE
jgi:hypothetical protein